MACDQPLHLSTRRGPVVGMHEFEKRHGGQFVDAVPQHALPGRIQPFEVAVIARDAQHVDR